MRKRFRFRREPQPLRISTPDGISEHAFNNQLLITPREAEVLLEYCGYLQLKVYKKGDALYRNEQPFHNGTTRLRITSFREIVKACLKLCNTLYEVERSRDYPNPDYITTILEDKQHLATIWERLTGQLAYDVDY
jgi:hypothetical protein